MTGAVVPAEADGEEVTAQAGLCRASALHKDRLSQPRSGLPQRSAGVAVRADADGRGLRGEAERATIEVMLLDLANLFEMHPRLGGLAEFYGGRAALGLERASHQSGVAIGLTIEAAESPGRVVWATAPVGDLTQYDKARVTEDAAEGVALALAHQAQGWRVWIRGQRGQFCDWLMERENGQGRQVLALEVGGLAEGALTSLLKEKLSQVARSPVGDRRCAVVVGLAAPEVRMCSHPVGEP